MVFGMIPSKINLEDFSLNEIKNAQKRYIQNLTSYIPNEVKLILDVGCVLEEMPLFLINQGYNVETLSPDDYQKMVIKILLMAPFLSIIQSLRVLIQINNTILFTK